MFDIDSRKIETAPGRTHRRIFLLRRRKSTQRTNFCAKARNPVSADNKNPNVHFEPGREDVLLRIASTYEAASKRRIPPPDFGPL